MFVCIIMSNWEGKEYTYINVVEKNSLYRNKVLKKSENKIPSKSILTCKLIINYLLIN